MRAHLFLLPKGVRKLFTVIFFLSISVFAISGFIPESAEYNYGPPFVNPGAGAPPFMLSPKSVTVLLDSAGAGGFEIGSTFAANGWTAINDTANIWRCGTQAKYNGTRGAYISRSFQDINNYNNAVTQVSHLYRNVTFSPGAGERFFVLSFRWKSMGEASPNDYFCVYLVPTDSTPTSGRLLGSGKIGSNYYNQSSWQTTEIIIDTAGNTGKTRRLVFSWINNNNALGSNPPAAIDNISLITTQPPPMTGTKYIRASGGDYINLYTAVNDLNERGVGTGGVKFLINSGETFNEPAGIILTATGTSSNRIIFKRDGTGMRPVINVPRTSTDSVMVLIKGGDYIVFDSLDLRSTTNIYKETIGFYLRGNDETTGCQYDTIRNCTINRTGSTLLLSIYSVAWGTTLANTNSFNAFINDSLGNCQRGITLWGSSSINDTANFIGGSELGKAYISGAYNTGIATDHQSGIRIMYMDINGGINNQGYDPIYCYARNMNISYNHIHKINTAQSGIRTLRIGEIPNTNIISNNIIHDMINNSTTKWMNGINISEYGDTVSVYNVFNNLIYDIGAPRYESGGQIISTVGIMIEGGKADSIFNNTVYLDYTTANTSNISAVIYIEFYQKNIDFRNNIFVNKVNLANVLSSASILYRRYSYLNDISLNSNNNLYYCGTPDSDHLIYNFVNSGPIPKCSTLAQYKSAVAPIDSAAISENPSFISISEPYNLHIDSTLVTTIESGGKYTSTVTKDLDGKSRYPFSGYPNNLNSPATAPDIGAYEFAGRRILSNKMTINPSGGDYPSISKALMDLNKFGPPSGGITYEIPDGAVINEPSPLTITATGTQANKIKFKRVRSSSMMLAGAKPVISVTGTSGSTDALIKITGGDYITFDSIDFRDAGTSSSDYCEYGIHFTGASASDGCQFDSVRNCNVTLNASNANTRLGIFLQSSATSYPGTNSNNKFFTDSIRNCTSGFYFFGSSSSSDTGNTVGSTGVLKTVIKNSKAYGINSSYQQRFNIFGTVIDSIPGSTFTYGIFSTNSGNLNFYSNEIKNISAPSGGNAAFGINIFTASGVNNIYRNTINSVSCSGADGSAFGLFMVGSGGNYNIYNNFIYDIKATASALDPAVAGIYIDAGSADSIFHNTVFLDYVSSNSSNRNACIYVSETPSTVDLRNNIFVNKVNVATGSKAAAFYMSSASYTNISANTNNNLYYAGTPTPKNLIFYDGINSDSLLTQYKTRLSPKDSDAVSVMPNFTSSTSPYDLHINTAYATKIESGGRSAYMVAADIDGNARYPRSGYPDNPSFPATAPDIGADEFAGKSKITGIYTIGPSGRDYSSISSAVNDLNDLGTGTGGVTFKIESGQTYYETPITITATGSAANPIVFKRYLTGSKAAGDKPIIYFTGTSSVDACITLAGSDYVVFDSLDIRDNGTTSSDFTDYGFSLIYGATTSDGCKYDTIRNCRVRLNNANTGSNGVYMYSSSSGTGTNNYNVFLNDSITQCRNGYYFSGASSADTMNIIGSSGTGVSAVCNITGYAMYFSRQQQLKVFRTEIDSVKNSLSSMGINISTCGNFELYNNEIHKVLSSSGNDAIGIYLTTVSGINRIYNNKIYDITNPTGSGRSWGIAEWSTSGITSNNIYNNFIYDIKSPSGTVNPPVVGLYLNGSSTDSVFHNTVYLDYTSLHSSNFSTGLYITTQTGHNVDLRNNIIINNCNMSTGTRAVSFYYGSSDLGKLSANTNNNLYYAGTPGPKNFIFFNGSNADTTISQYLARVTPKDSDAVTEFPYFKSRTSPYDLRIDSTASSVIESGGKTAYIASDIYGTPRYPNAGYPNNTTWPASAPDIGADEFGGRKNFTPPVITYTLLANNSSLTSYSVTNVSIADSTKWGIDSASGKKPRVYYKRSADTNAFIGNANTDKGWKWVEANNNTSLFNFTIDYSKIFGGAVYYRDTIRYFITAQNQYLTPGLSANPSTGFAGTSVGNITSAPATPNYYVIQSTSPMSGTYAIGMSAFKKISGRDISFEKRKREVVVDIYSEPVSPERDKDNPDAVKVTEQNIEVIGQKLAEEEYSVMFENGVEVLKENEGVLFAKINNLERDDKDIRGVYARITDALADIKANGMTGPVVFRLDDASYNSETYPLRIDSIPGSSGVNTLTIIPKTGVTPLIQGGYPGGVFELSQCKYVTINGIDKSLTIQNTNTSGQAIVIKNDASNNTIKNTNLIGTVTSSTSGVVVFSTTTYATGCDNNILDSNDIYGGATKPSNGVCLSGTSGKTGNNNIVSNNRIYNFSGSGIKIVNYYPYTTLQGNEIFESTPASTSSLTGIYVDYAAARVDIVSNYIHDLKSDYSGPSLRGIHLYNCVPGDVLFVCNNIINLEESYVNNSAFVTGIENYTNTGTFGRIYNNSIYIGGSGISGGASYGFYKSWSNYDTLYNNIIYNARSNTSGTASHYGIYTTASYLSTLYSNNNNIYSGGTGGKFGYIGSDKNTLADWISGTGLDRSSYSGNPGYLNSRLMIDSTNSNCWNEYLKGMPLAAVTTDYRGLARSTEMLTGPVCAGAYEFTTTLVPPVVSASGTGTLSLVQSGKSLLDVSGITADMQNRNPVEKLKSGGEKEMRPSAMTVYAQRYSGSGVLDTAMTVSPDGIMMRASIPLAKTGLGYLKVTTGGTDPAAPVGIVYYYSSEELGNITSESDLILAMYDFNNKVWVPFAQGSGDGQSNLNTTNKTITVTGITRLHNTAFMLCDKNYPLKRAGLDLTLMIQGLYSETVLGKGTNSMVQDTVWAVIYKDSPWTRLDSIKVVIGTSGSGFGFGGKWNSTDAAASTGANYWIVIRHRSAVETWSALGTNQFSKVTGVLAYDFTTAANKAYGDNMILTGTKYCIYNGDINHDGTVDLNDIIPVLSDYDNLDYHIENDMNLDWTIDLNDAIYVLSGYDNLIGAVIPSKILNRREFRSIDKKETLEKIEKLRLKMPEQNDTRKTTERKNTK